MDIPAGRVIAIRSVLCVMKAAQRRQFQLNELVLPQTELSKDIVVFDRQTIRHVLKLLDLTTRDSVLGEADSLSFEDTAIHLCHYLFYAGSTGAVTGGLVNELCFSRGLAKIVTKYSAGEGGGEGECIACPALVIFASTMQILRDNADANYQGKLLDAICAPTRVVSPQEGIEETSEGISTESLRSLSQTVMEALRQTAAVKKLRAVPLTRRSKAIEKALSGGYLQVRANCTPRLVSFHQSALSSLQHSVLCYQTYPRIKLSPRADLLVPDSIGSNDCNS